MNNLFKKLLPDKNRESNHPRTSYGELVKKKKEQKRFSAGALVIVLFSHEDYFNSAGKKIRRPKEWGTGIIFAAVSFLEGQEESTQVELEVLDLPKKSLFEKKNREQWEEWQSNDVWPLLSPENAILSPYDQRMLMRLDAKNPKSQFAWAPREKTIVVTADLLYSATSAAWMKLLLAR